MIEVMFGPLQMHTALTLIMPAMKNLSSVFHRAPCLSAIRPVEKFEALIEGLPQMYLSELAKALKISETWGEAVIKALSKILIQGGAFVQKTTNCSADRNLISMGAGLPT